MSDMERDRLLAIKSATLSLAEALGLKLVDGRKLRVSAEPSRRIDVASDTSGLRLTLAKTWVKAMATVDAELGEDFVSSPVWPILIDLYISEATDRPVAISDACRAARIAPTTALRWVHVLEGRGFIYRQDDIRDKRRAFLRLTSLGREKVEAVLDRVTANEEQLGLIRVAPRE
ncbi:hypothetical protein M527_29150 [Sphingobium indicum IP26]|uniref:hypothetical protein n=1 Tax=Sphingobium sp. HDIP04 TaxID=428994 RepID=UPI000372331E|nr:hypothetical protein [Sphingobium sp. HDIP04]EPR14183.1 hypothetical protein M527_29150 [Sphingobium indicum IP26]EQB03666.1 hypothetical protein L286_11615 [Sphingobium sp. HDIP04]